jgi:uncharacterized transporter YbjL
MSVFEDRSTYQGSKRWTFGWMLGTGYLFTFVAMTLSNPYSMEIGCAFGCLLSGLMIQAWRSAYFLNQWDAFLHWVIVLDIFLEAILIPSHDHWGFLLCGLAFGTVIVSYRNHQLKIQTAG